MKTIELPSINNENHGNFGDLYGKSDDNVAQYDGNMPYNNPKSLVNQVSDENGGVGGGTNSTIASTGIKQLHHSITYLFANLLL